MASSNHDSSNRPPLSPLQPRVRGRRLTPRGGACGGPLDASRPPPVGHRLRWAPPPFVSARSAGGRAARGGSVGARAGARVPCWFRLAGAARRGRATHGRASVRFGSAAARAGARAPVSRAHGRPSRGLEHGTRRDGRRAEGSWTPGGEGGSARGRAGRRARGAWRVRVGTAVRSGLDGAAATDPRLRPMGTWPLSKSLIGEYRATGRRRLASNDPVRADEEACG
jgi:hypothetical protein